MLRGKQKREESAVLDRGASEVKEVTLELRFEPSVGSWLAYLWGENF